MPWGTTAFSESTLILMGVRVGLYVLTLWWVQTPPWLVGPQTWLNWPKLKTLEGTLLCRCISQSHQPYYFTLHCKSYLLSYPFLKFSVIRPTSAAPKSKHKHDPKTDPVTRYVNIFVGHFSIQTKPVPFLEHVYS